jgi:hypothetical protein
MPPGRSSHCPRPNADPLVTTTTTAAAAAAPLTSTLTTAAATATTTTPQAQRYLQDHLDAWESFAAVSGRPARICRVPPPMQPAAFRPIMLDTASGAIDYPSLNARLNKPEEAKSTFAKWMGW